MAGAFHENFAARFGGTVEEIDWCIASDGGIRPSCDGHSIIRVPADQFAAACEASDAEDDDWNNWGSIQVVSE